MSDSQMQLGDIICSFSLREEIGQKKKYVSKRHCNAEYEYFIILSGSCRMDVEDKAFNLSAGDGILIPPKKYHLTLDMSEDFQNIILPFSLKSLTGDRITPIDSPKIISVTQSSLEDARQMCLCMSAKKTFYRASAEARFSLIVLDVLSQILPQKLYHKTASNIEEEQLNKIDDFFERSLTDNATVADLAKIIHLSVRQTSRVLYKVYGMNFSEKKLHARMDKATYLLRTTDLSISEISESVGYVSENSFFKSFKNLHGVPPTKYRKAYKL